MVEPLSSALWRRTDELLEAAFDLPPEERGPFLDRVLGDDEPLRQVLEELLEADASAEKVFKGLEGLLSAELTGFLAGPEQLASEAGAGAKLTATIPERIAHFKILRLLGSGGMGEVYLAHDTRLDRQVALKLIRGHRLGSRRARQEFLKEARLTARFNHPNIVTIHEVGEHRGEPYLALEYLEGTTLRARIGDGRLELQEVLSYALAIAEALAAAHRHGVLHRDLKPGNVYLLKDGGLRILDFGTAKAVVDGIPAAYPAEPSTASPQTAGAPLSPTRSLVQGTPAYMAPEQWQGEACTAATDLWALGMLMTEMLAGEHPWAGCSIAEMRNRACEPVEPFTLPAVLQRDWPELSRLVNDCLETSPERRPSAETVVRVLRDLLDQGSSERRSRRSRTVLAVRMVGSSWLAAAIGCLLALLTGVLGQGIGAMAGGCTWIGATLPIHRQPWALVNQPDMAFAGKLIAAPYWLGSSLLPLLLAVLLVPASRRIRTTTGRVLALQVSWSFVVVAGGWVALLDPSDGHVPRWLSLHGLPAALVWLLPLAALLVGLLPMARLLDLLHAAFGLGDWMQRLGGVMVNLGAPVLVWVAVAAAAGGRLPGSAAAAVMVPLLGAVWVALARQPVAVEEPRRISAGGLVALVLILLVLVGAVLVAGRPLPDGRVAGVQWSAEQSTSNIRDWIETIRLDTPPAD